MIKLKDILNERIPTLPKINMGFGEVQTYAKMMIKKSNDIIKSAKSGDMGKTKKITKLHGFSLHNILVILIL